MHEIDDTETYQKKMLKGKILSLRLNNNTLKCKIYCSVKVEPAFKIVETPSELRHLDNITLFMLDQDGYSASGNVVYKEASPFADSVAAAVYAT